MSPNVQAGLVAFTVLLIGYCVSLSDSVKPLKEYRTFARTCYLARSADDGSAYLYICTKSMPGN